MAIISDFPPDRTEWNDRFRAAVQPFWKGDAADPRVRSRPSVLDVSLRPIRSIRYRCKIHPRPPLNVKLANYPILK
jgi:hypothetical protein